MSDINRGNTGSGRVEVHPLPHHRAVLSHAPGVADRPQPPFRWHGRHHGDCHWCAGLLLGATKLDVAAGQDAETQRLLHRAVWQVPRSARVGDESGRSVRCLADRRRWLRVLLRFHRRRGQPVVPDALRGNHVGGAGEDAGRGLPPGRRHDRQGDCVDWPAEKSRPRQAVLHLLRARCDTCAAPRAEGMGRQVQKQVRRWLGQAARGNVRAPEEARRDPRRLSAYPQTQGNPVVGRHAGSVQASAPPGDGGVRRVHGVHRSSCRPVVRFADQAGDRR